MPIFCVKSVKIYTGQKNLHEYSRGARDKYEVCLQILYTLLYFTDSACSAYPCYNSKAFSAKSHNKRGNLSLCSQNTHKQTFSKAIERLHTVNHEHYYLLVSLEFPTGRK